MARGGRRAGRAGKQYPNRSDLSLAPRTAPVTPIPGQGYGKQTQQVQLQREGAAQVAQIAERRPPLPAFDRATERPQEPITAGLPIGPGPGPEILGADISAPQEQANFTRLARFLPVLEIVASKPDTSQLTRDMVRRVRGAIPPATGP